MIPLSRAALRYVVDICCERENYKVLIASSDSSMRENIEKVLLAMACIADTEKVINTRGEFKIIFKNGSLIKVIRANESSRGNKAHAIIVDPEVDREIKDCVLRPMETLERV